MERTPDQAAADDAMAAAIVQHASAYGYADETDFIAEWAAVVCTQPIEGSNRVGYHTIFPDNYLANHRAVGL